MFVHPRSPWLTQGHSAGKSTPRAGIQVVCFKSFASAYARESLASGCARQTQKGLWRHSPPLETDAKEKIQSYSPHLIGPT